MSCALIPIGDKSKGQFTISELPLGFMREVVLYIFTMPLKPMKAIARIPAEMRAMGIPFIEAGSSVRESCSRIPAKTTRASVKPIAMEIA